MIRDAKLLHEFEKEQTRNEKLTPPEALAIFEAMWREGLTLGVLPLEDPLEGIEVDIRLARILNHV